MGGAEVTLEESDVSGEVGGCTKTAWVVPIPQGNSRSFEGL